MLWATCWVERTRHPIELEAEDRLDSYEKTLTVLSASVPGIERAR
jgi:hypothetical protein